MSEVAEEKPGKLSPELEGKFKLAPGAGAGEYHWQGNVVNLTTLSLASAVKLVKKGFPYLVEKAEVKLKPAPANS